MKSKSLIALILTLVIGIVIGMLSSTFLHERKMKEFRSYSSFEGFKYHFLKILEPTEEQKKKIIPIIDDFSRKNQEIKSEYRKDFGVLMKEFKDELDPLLTKEQKERLENLRKKRKPRDSKGNGRPDGRRRDGSGPPPTPFFYE